MKEEKKGKKEKYVEVYEEAGSRRHDRSKYNARVLNILNDTKERKKEKRERREREPQSRARRSGEISALECRSLDLVAAPLCASAQWLH